MTRLLVDNREIEAEEGTNLLQACLMNGIYIPNLCCLEGMDEPPASCRLCFVEVGGWERPVSACAMQVKEGMVVRTDTAAVRGLQKAAFQLLMSVHDVDCGPCPANRRCELQRIAKHLKIGLKPGPLERILKKTALVQEHPLIDYHPNRCVLCGRCLQVCRRRDNRPIMSFAGRGFDTVITFFGEKDTPAPSCEACLTCVKTCPVAAITLREPSQTGLTRRHPSSVVPSAAGRRVEEDTKG